MNGDTVALSHNLRSAQWTNARFTSLSSLDLFVRCELRDAASSVMPGVAVASTIPLVGISSRARITSRIKYRERY